MLMVQTSYALEAGKGTDELLNVWVETFGGCPIAVRKAVTVGLYITNFAGDAGPTIIWNMIWLVFIVS